MSERTEFEQKLATEARAVEALLDQLLSSDIRADEIARPERLRAAMRHGVLNGGKRLRPFLVMEKGPVRCTAAGSSARRSST